MKPAHLPDMGHSIYGLTMQNMHHSFPSAHHSTLNYKLYRALQGLQNVYMYILLVCFTTHLSIRQIEASRRTNLNPGLQSVGLVDHLR